MRTYRLLEVSAERLVGEDEDMQPLLEETSSEERLEFKLDMDKLLANDPLLFWFGAFSSSLLGVLELTLSTDTGCAITVQVEDGGLIDVEVDFVDVFLGRMCKLKRPDT